MRNPDMLGSYSLQFMELAMHCFYSPWIFFSAMSAIAFDTLNSPNASRRPGSPSIRPSLGRCEAESSNRTGHETRHCRHQAGYCRRQARYQRIEWHAAQRDKQLDVTLRNEIKQLDVTCVARLNSLMSRSNRSVRPCPDLKDLEYRMTIKLGTMMASCGRCDGDAGKAVVIPRFCKPGCVDRCLGR